MGLNGSAPAIIRRWLVFNSDGSTEPVDPGPNHIEMNSVVIPNAASITFELSGYLVIAYAQASIFIL